MPQVLVFWRPPKEIRTNATRYFPARRNNLPRAGQISYLPLAPCYVCFNPCNYGVFPLFSPTIIKSYFPWKAKIIALDLSVIALDLSIVVVDLTNAVADLTLHVALLPFIRYLTTF